MTDPRQFDELARRKLEEREFAFDEAAWTDMQRLLAKDRDRGGAWKWWTLAGAAVLLIGLAVWWNADEEPAVVSSTAQVDAVEPTTPVEASTELPAVTESESADKMTDVVPAITQPVAPIIERESIASDDRSVTAASGRSRKEEGIAATIAQPQAEEHAVVPPTPPESVPAPPVVVVAEPAMPDPVQDGPMTDPITTTGDQAADTANLGRPSILPAVIPVAVLDAATTEPADNGATTAANDAGSEQATTDKAAVSDTTQGTIDPEVVAPSAVGDSTTATTSDPVANATPSASAPAAPALVPAKAPWEISALGGMMLGASNYSGTNSDAWKEDVSSMWAPSAGGELMHMGRNFGLGIGLHYTTYAEQLNIAEQTVAETITLDSNYFEPTPMMLLVITDVIQINGVTYYVTETLDTVINVLVRSTMTTTQNRVVTPARDQTNRVSYFEVPVLFDAHLVQGPWSLGIRGGPMVGFLSTRRGAVPNVAMDGYTEFSDQRFNEVVFGYTARAYVRYRFNDAWSVGLEPGIKGHLMNGLAEGDLSRRTTAWGGMLSVSYRLR